MVTSSSAATGTPGNCTGTVKVTCRFYYNGTEGSDGSAQTWRVPAGVHSARFDVYGAQGGSYEGITTGGLGGETTATLALTPRSLVTLFVGGVGTGMAGGFNGGGGSLDNDPSFFGGGGATDIRIGGRSLNDRVLVAGGGGGGGDMCANSQCSHGGAGGGRRGGTGTTSAPGGDSAGAGGTQWAGGAGAAGGASGTRGQGGASLLEGGGGGGGYFGGGGGGFDYPTVGAGGGGSSYFSPDRAQVRSAWTKAGVHTGDGMIVITYTRPA
jgi:hypothetical protein